MGHDDDDDLLPKLRRIFRFQNLKGRSGVRSDRWRERRHREGFRRPVFGFPAVDASDDTGEGDLLERRSERTFELFFAVEFAVLSWDYR